MSREQPDTPPVPMEAITERIHHVRGQRVMLDEDLASLYGVEVRALNQAVSRNPGRFPEDFTFRLTPEEWERLRSQIVISKRGRGGRRYPPFAFTQEGVAMLSSVLQSERAVRVNVEIMRVFVRFRRFLAGQQELAAKLRELESRFEGHFTNQDRRIRLLFEAVRRLRDEMEKPPPPRPGGVKRRIGFHTEEEPESGGTGKERSSKPGRRRKPRTT